MTSHKVEADDVCDGPKHRSSCSTVEEDLAAATSRNAISKAPRAAAIAVAISSFVHEAPFAQEPATLVRWWGYSGSDPVILAGVMIRRSVTLADLVYIGALQCKHCDPRTIEN